MAIRFLDKKTHRFHFQNQGADASYVLIFGDEVDAPASATGIDPEDASYRGRDGTWARPPLTTSRPTEMYFLDVGQGDAAFVVTPNNTKILVDGGLKERALGFLIWKYRLDEPGNRVTIDHLFLSHGDKDHIEGLIPLLGHPGITVSNIYHNGIAIFAAGEFNESIGNKDGNRLTTVHDRLAELNGANLASNSSAVFDDWIIAVRASGANYQRLDRSDGVFDIGDPDITVEIVSPIFEPDGSPEWFSDKGHTINGHSLTFRLTQGNVRAYFSGDLNPKGSDHVLGLPTGALDVNAHILKAPHHGSHEYRQELFDAVNPMITVVSSGETSDHGHPRANFLAAIGRSGRGPEPLLFSTELAALFVDAGDADSVADAGNVETGLADLDFAADPNANSEARLRFKKVLPGIINVRTDGTEMYAFRRVAQYYQWESYGPITPVI